LSENAASKPSPRSVALYALAGALALFELATLWAALNPTAPEAYRAYFIDKTTTCLNLPKPGTYALGSTVSFRSDGAALARDLRVCGWEGPAGDGTHSVGETSRLRFAVPPGVGDLRLTLELAAVLTEGQADQLVEVSANGVAVGRAEMNDRDAHVFELVIPAAALASDPGFVNIALDFPRAIRMAPGDNDTRKRAVKLLSARLAPA